jgi:flagellar hook-associated protein 3 FlgL
MSRVSEQSSIHAVKYAVGNTKARLEDLQIKGSSLKRIQRPSDDPIGNIELLAIRSQKVDSKQYLRNANYAKTLLSFTENSLTDLTDIVAKAKEIAIGQSSDLFNPDVRKSISKEVHQLRLQAISISNKRLGNRYIFGGYKTQTKPFDENGKYHGDDGKVKLEVNKDFFLPINMNGKEVFFHSNKSNIKSLNVIPTPQQSPELIDQPIERPSNQPQPEAQRGLASVKNPRSQTAVNLFDDLQSLENALLTDNPDVIQNLLESLDKSHNRFVTLRTEVGALTNSIANAENTIENSTLLNEAYKSKIEDADVAELFSDISKQQNVLKATYKSSGILLNQSLLDFVR